jgi:large subunit ribosomal protein L10
LAITKERKEELVSQYADLVARSEALILTNYKGLNMAKLTKLRNQVREANGAYYVTKNTLIRLVLEQKGVAVPAAWLEGPTAVGFCFDNVPSIAKAITDFAAAEPDFMSVKGALLGDKAVGAAKVKALADLPPLDVLKAQMLGTLTAPLAGVVGVLNGALAGLVGVLEARREQLGEPEAA